MTPYYERDGITIYCGECSQVMSQYRFLADLVLTDPPYGINGSSRHINKNRAKGNYLDGFEDTPEYVQAVIVPIIKRLIALCGCVVLTPGNKNFSLYPQPDSFGCFYQPASAGLQVFGNCDAQPIFYYGKNASRNNMGVPCSYQLTETPERNGHPCVKPILAWKKLLANISLPGQLVFDPFMGSGTTLRAAQDLNRRAIGIEISEDYCRIAVDRLRQPSFFSIPDEPATAKSSQLTFMEAG